ncbi:hypothetical protein CMU69_18710 [Elizabethkingia anophelis]|nr:hypothetical protein CQS02_02095 [Elizabethkingia miricola]MDV3561551.1 hypothetical protein [Elizabethkingia anophelis]
MKNVFFILGIFILFECCAQQKIIHKSTSNSINDSIMFEKFDFDLDANNYAGYEYADDSYYNYGANGFYKLKNGAVFSPYNGKSSISCTFIPAAPAFYSIDYIYYEKGNMRAMGKIAGFSSGIKIGKWKLYDESGKVTEVDEDKKFGLWDFDKVLAVLDKDGVINLKTGKNREFEKLQFFYDKDKKEWKIKVFKKNINVIVEEYWEYLFDGNTGKYTRDWYERYNKNAEKDMNLPPLKNSRANKNKKQ